MDRVQLRKAQHIPGTDNYLFEGTHGFATPLPMTCSIDSDDYGKYLFISTEIYSYGVEIKVDGKDLDVPERMTV